MNRAQFMEQLKKLLSDISEEERQEALDYYESYFDDAGEDQETEVIRELGSPDDERQMPQSRAEKGYHAERRGGKAGVILVLILLVFISPLIKGTVGGIIGFIVALILLPFILVLGTGAVVLALFAIAVIAIGAGIGACVTATPAFGALGIGIGLILLSLGLAGLVFFVWAASRALPAILRRFTDFCGNILNRGKKGGDRA